MRADTIQKLLAINRLFYQTFANEFDATRQRVQPGVARVLTRVLETASPTTRILDLGCGNGEVARELARRGFQGEYMGVDFSEGLVEKAHQVSGEKVSGVRYQFLVADLTAPDWEAELDGPFDAVFAFAVLHHLPTRFHAEILRKVHVLLTRHPEARLRVILESRGETLPEREQDHPAPRGFLAGARNDSAQDGVFILSNWQFLNSPRWRARIQPWERVGLTIHNVDANDYLLDWRRGGEGLRYVHHFSEDELAALAAEARFEIEETFFLDGAEGNLGLYQFWRPQ